MRSQRGSEWIQGWSYEVLKFDSILDSILRIILRVDGTKPMQLRNMGKWSNHSFFIETGAIEVNGSITIAWKLLSHDRSVEMEPKQRNRLIIKRNIAWSAYCFRESAAHHVFSWWNQGWRHEFSQQMTNFIKCSYSIIKQSSSMLFICWRGCYSCSYCADHGERIEQGALKKKKDRKYWVLRRN